MIYLINSLNRFALSLVLFGVLLSACVGTSPGPPPLKMEALEVRADGNLATRDALRLTCITSGGAGGVVYEFRLRKEGVESILYRGDNSELRWLPKEPGNYRLRAIASDAAGTSVAGKWSAEYRFVPPISRESLLAVLPVENLSDRKAPMDDIRDLVVGRLTEAGMRVLDKEAMEEFMRKHRIRDVGGLNPANSRQFREELGVDAVVITSLETWYQTAPPRVSLISRVVATDPDPTILWIDSVGLAGDQSPGLLGVGRIDDPRRLLDRATARLVASFENYLSGRFPSFIHGADPREVRLLHGEIGTADGSLFPVRFRHKPRFTYRSPQFDPSREYRVALIPLLNVNTRKHAGKIVALHLLEQLQRYENIRIYEPGQIMDILLRYRMIMQAGPSLAASDVLADDNILGADLIMSGKVFDYQDAIGESKVDFSIQAFAGLKREVVWTSRSYAGGDDGVVFFKLGNISTAHDLAGRLTKAAIQLLEE